MFILQVYQRKECYNKEINNWCKLTQRDANHHIQILLLISKFLLVVNIKFEISALQNSFMMVISTMASKLMFRFGIWSHSYQLQQWPVMWKKAVFQETLQVILQQISQDFQTKGKNIYLSSGGHLIPGGKICSGIQKRMEFMNFDYDVILNQVWNNLNCFSFISILS